MIDTRLALRPWLGQVCGPIRNLEDPWPPSAIGNLKAGGVDA
jgi:hypothetical protein